MAYHRSLEHSAPEAIEKLLAITSFGGQGYIFVIVVRAMSCVLACTMHFHHVSLWSMFYHDLVLVL